MTDAALRFDNRFVAALPGDPEAENFRRDVAGACYSRVQPTAVRAPQRVAYSIDAARLLDLDAAQIESDGFTAVLAGNRLLPGMDPYATCYGGHQFGNWAGQLGDGRAINLGEVLNRRGERWAMQLKGAGATPYSRSADGLAVLRSSIREFLCSEAMFHLGVPTTRALSVVTTGESVMRDMFYDGHAAPEPGAVVCRLAPSFTRFGHFEILAARGDVELLRRLVDFTIATDFPGLDQGGDRTDVYLAWFETVCNRTARMVAHWMRVGFVHGVMNTDNMSIVGLTIDYGPYGWIDNYDPNWTPNTTDAAQRRYRFGQQAAVAQWNLLQLANAIFPLIDAANPLEELLRGFMRTFQADWQAMLAQKLGLTPSAGTNDAPLFAELDAVLQLAETDMTIFFRQLGDLDPGEPEPVNALLAAYYVPEQLTHEIRQRIDAWLRSYLVRIRAEKVAPQQRRAAMHAVNPKFVLRNYLAQLAIDDAHAGDYAKVNELLDVLRTPYAEAAGKDELARKRPDWARHRAGCSMLSCSS